LRLVSNLSKGTLSVAINTTDTSVVLNTGEGDTFPVVAAPDDMVAFLDDGTNVEAVLITAHTSLSETFTVTRAAQKIANAGPTAYSFGTGTKFQHRLSMGQVDEIETALLGVPPHVGGAEVFRKIAGQQQWPLLRAVLGNSQWSLIRWVPTGVSGTVQALGATTGQTGTAANPTFATTSLATRHQRVNYASAASANAACGTKQTSPPYQVRSTTAGRGGFFFHARFVLDTNMGASHARLFVGLHSASADLITDPSALTGDFVAIAYDAADTKLRLMTRDGTTLTNTDLGATVPKTDGLMYDVYLYCPPGGAAIYYRVDKSDGNTFTERAVEGSVTATLPTTDIPLYLRMQGGTSAATAVTIGISHFGCFWQTN
jgi:hypothetical protein